MYIIELMSTTTANLSYGKMIALFVNLNDAMTYSRSKSRTSAHLVRVSKDGREGEFYFSQGEQTDYYGRSTGA